MTSRPATATTPAAAADSHPSICASMDDFEARGDFSPTLPELPSQHSGFRSNVSDSVASASSRRSFSPPAWRKAGSGWFRHQQPSPERSKDPSPEYHSAYDDDDEDGPDAAGLDGGEDAGEVTVYPLPARVPLPVSPTKGRSPSVSPEPTFGGGVGAGDRGRRHATLPTAEREPNADARAQMNYIRFSTSLDVIQRTEPIEAAVAWVRKVASHVTESRHNILTYTIGSLLLYWLCSNLLGSPRNAPAPDLIKVAGLAKSFEPVIYYSEHGHAQIEELHDTGVAVWDLGESVRSSNMTAGPMIVHQLDELSDSMKTLAVELTRFFAGVDADVDSILLVMEWAQRELTTIAQAPPSALGSAWSNAHGMLLRAGLLRDGPLARDLLGQTHAQRTAATLERAFHEFLGVLEESIGNELAYSMQLFALFEAIDKQFLNLQRTVIREQDAQERLESDFLGSLWTKVIGANAGRLRKYAKNRDLLASVRDRTVRNKHVLVDHNQRLLQLRSNLEILRRKLVSPLVRSRNSTTLSVHEQIRGLEGTYNLLKASREQQKRKMMELVYGAGSRRANLIGETEVGGRTLPGGSYS